MLFNSFHFLIFFAVIFFLYYALPVKFRPALLLIGSYYFYMCWKPAYIILILLATLINYACALFISKYRQHPFLPKLFLTLGIVTSLSFLFVYKYLNFFGDILNHLFGIFSVPVSIPVFSIILPVGISFYTFQAMSYTIDVYRGTTKPEKSFWYFALFVSFFPQLVAGPIEKSENLLPQLHKPHPFDYQNVTWGLKLMAVGFFKKVVVADNAAGLVNTVFNNVHQYSGGILVLATVLFAFQIYCDFSGYSDIARGCAKTLGIDLMQNFRSPYFAKSPKEFWRRWHISLSTWFRDYVYIPLGGSRCALPLICFNLIFTFFLSGLWHGANYTFVLWGLIHGFYLAILAICMHYAKPASETSLFQKSFLHHLRKFFSILLTFALICFAWLFFRANTVSDAFYIIQNSFSNIFSLKSYISQIIVDLKDIIGGTSTILLTIHLLVLFAIDLLDEKIGVVKWVSEKPLMVRWSLYLIFVLYILLYMPKNTPAAFIYFQF